MSRIDDIFARLKAEGRKALMPFVCGGHPIVGGKPTPTSELLAALDRGGASIVEVGIPFSDPIADGPVIAAAMHESLKAGTTPRAIFEDIKAIRQFLSCGLVAMVSVSIVHRWQGGPRAFIGAAADAGFDGFIFPDAPLEESAELRQAAADAGLSASLMVAPTTPPARAKAIAAASTGFVYVLARTGITGEQTAAPDVGGLVNRLREATPLPLAVGFGIGTAEHVRAAVKPGGNAAAGADAAIVGSALVRRLTDAAKSGRDVAAAAEQFARELAAGL